MDKLNFGFLAHDDILEATVDGGYYHIFQGKAGFSVRAFVANESYNVGDFEDIYTALDGANDHYYFRQKLFKPLVLPKEYK